ncbi:MAG: hypothetical protein RI897_4233 [Verrucomicrobiota bacterium]
MEEEGEGFFGDTDSGVFDFDEEQGVGVGFAGSGDVEDYLAFLGKLECIDYEVRDDLVQASGVAVQAIGHISIDESDEFDPFGLGAIGDHFYRGIDGGPEVEVDLIEVDFSGLDLGEVEDFINDVEEGFRAVVDSFDVFGLVAVEAGIAEEDGHADDAVQGGSDFVADIGEELGFKPEGFYGGIPGVGEFGEEAFSFRDIDHGADDAGAVAVRVAHDEGAVCDIGIGAVLLCESIFS